MTGPATMFWPHVSWCADVRQRRKTHVVADKGVVALGGEDGVRDTLGLGEVRDLSVNDGEGVRVEAGDELDVSARGAGGGGDGAVRRDRESGERLEREGGVRGRAAGDKLCGDRVDLVEVERGVLGARPSGPLIDGGREPTLVARLGSKDRAGDGDVCRLGDGRRRAEVGGDADVLDDGSEAHEGDRVNNGRECVSARLGRGGAERARQERDVLRLVARDIGHPVAYPVGVAGFHEVVLGELAELRRVSEVCWTEGG